MGMRSSLVVLVCIVDAAESSGPGEISWGDFSKSFGALSVSSAPTPAVWTKREIAQLTKDMKKYPLQPVGKEGIKSQFRRYARAAGGSHSVLSTMREYRQIQRGPTPPTPHPTSVPPTRAPTSSPTGKVEVARVGEEGYIYARETHQETQRRNLRCFV